VAACDYPTDIVGLGYFVQNQQAGSKAELDAFGQELFDAYNQFIVDAWGGITPPLAEPSNGARGVQAVMAHNAAGTNKEQALAAVKAYQIIRGL